MPDAKTESALVAAARPTVFALLTGIASQSDKAVARCP